MCRVGGEKIETLLHKVNNRLQNLTQGNGFRINVETESVKKLFC